MVTLLLCVCAVSPGIAQPVQTDRVIHQIQAAESRFPGISVIIHNRHTDPGVDAWIKKIKARQSASGPQVHVNGNGDYEYFSAFTKDKDLWVGGRDSSHAFNPKSEIKDILGSERTIIKGNNRYSVIDFNGSSIANEGPVRRTILGIRDLGWRLPGSTYTLSEELKARQFRVVGASQDPQWRNIIHLEGNWNDNGIARKANIGLASDFDSMIVQCEIESDKRVARFRVGKMEKIKGFWIPTECESEDFDKSAPSTPTKDSYKVTNVLIGGLTQAQWLKTLSFSKIIDGRTGKKYNISSTGERFLSHDFANTNSYGAYFWGWLYTGSVTTLLVLTVGAYVKWKYNQLAKPL